MCSVEITTNGTRYGKIATASDKFNIVFNYTLRNYKYTKTVTRMYIFVYTKILKIPLTTRDRHIERQIENTQHRKRKTIQHQYIKGQYSRTKN